MRFNQRIAIITSVCTLAFISLVLFVRGTIRFVHIFGAHPGVSVSQQEIWDKFHEAKNSETQQIPKITHHIFHNWKDPGSDVLPEDWKATRQTCIDKNPGWEHKLWATEDSREFLEKEYPWFLSTYDNYPHPVQRVDALKYFLMLHYGGIYLDMDNGCLESLDSLLYYPTWITDGGHGALSNNILGSAPGHPFYKLVTSSLIPYSYNYHLPYMTVHYGSGQWFISAVWNTYHEALSQDAPESLHAQSDKFTNEPLTRVQMDMRPGSAKWVFFNAGRGGTWISADARFFNLIGNVMVPKIREHAYLYSFGALAVFALSIWGCICCRRRRKTKGYTMVKDEDIEFGERNHTFVVSE